MIGFTGTRRGMTEAQAGSVDALLRLAADVRSGVSAHRAPAFHHGLCVGADAQAHDIARTYGYRIYGHPASDVRPEWISDAACDDLLPAAPALARNREIAAQSILIAAPGGEYEVHRSGTWATIRAGWKSRGTVVYVVRPDGSVRAREDRP